jgi:hypothetical protein
MIVNRGKMHQTLADLLLLFKKDTKGDRPTVKRRKTDIEIEDEIESEEV